MSTSQRTQRVARRVHAERTVWQSPVRLEFQHHVRARKVHKQAWGVSRRSEHEARHLRMQQAPNTCCCDAPSPARPQVPPPQGVSSFPSGAN